MRNKERYRIFAILLLLAGIDSLSAVSFDCAKASNQTEKRICASAGISAADDRLAEVYRKTRDQVLNRPLLIEDQRYWLMDRNVIVNENELLRFYKDRMSSLQAIPRAGTIRFRADNCSDFLRRNRIENVADCRVGDMGTIGTMGRRTYGYAIYCIVPREASGDQKDCNSGGYYSQMGLAVYMRENGSREDRLILERADIGGFGLVYDVPDTVSNAYGTFLYLPIIVDGTGNGNASEYYLWNPRLSEWILLDSETWLRDLEKRLPRGLSAWKGIWPDIETMTAEAALYREGDGNCCATGGTAKIRLALEGKRFKIKSVVVRKQVD